MYTVSFSSVYIEGSSLVFGSGFAEAKSRTLQLVNADICRVTGVGSFYFFFKTTAFRK